MDDLTSEFLVETNESLEALDLDIIKLEQNPEDAETISNIFRVMHTIKGTCGFLGLSRLESVAHSAENIMDKLRNDDFKVTPQIASLILEAVDSIKAIIEHLEETEAEPEGTDEELICRLNNCADNKGAIVAGKDSEESDKPDEIQITKTADLDEEIDFTPIPAPDEIQVTKTADLDEEIDFTPIPAPDATTSPTVPAVTEQPSVSTAKKAISEGLKTADASASKKNASAGKSIRVSLDVLEGLMQMVGELVLTRNQLLQLMRNTEGHGQHDESANAFTTPLQRLNLITSELQEGVMQTRMQPIGNAWAKFPRIIRDLSIDLGKKINLEMIGAETDLDRQMLEAIKDPLTHMVRNSADHGIETPEERIAAGKSETGTVTLSAYHEGGHIMVKISDDGRGLDVEKIKKKAYDNGLATEGELESMSKKQIYQFVFKAGFSTAEKVTSVSGRGVGMDVVVNNIEKIGGTVELNSKEGKGSEFVVKLPLTLAIMPVLIVQSGDEIFAIPQIRVSEIVRTENITKNTEEEDTGHIVETINDAPVLRLRGRLLPLISLAKTLQFTRKQVGDNDNINNDTDAIEPFIVVCEVGSQSFGILVDKVFHTEEIVVKPVSPLIKDVEVYSGCTILGDGSVIMILDPNGIIKTSGVVTLHEEDDGSSEDRSAARERIVSFLLFKSWDNAPKAVPLEVVSRLEEIDMSKVEWSAGKKVVQYRDNLMHLTTLDPSTEIPETGIHEIIVFADESRIMGLVVEEIMDIVKQEMDVKSMVGSGGVLGSLVIDGTTTDLMDISYFFSDLFSEWLGNNTQPDIDIGEKQDHILLVDDSPFFRKFMKPILVVSGYYVTVVESAAEALELLNVDNIPFDVVVTDIDMPDMNGIEFTKTCKANPSIAAIPFIALTSHTEDDFEESFADIGFSGSVLKSEREQLISTLVEVLSSNQKAA